MTNLEWIRTLSEEEFADWLYDEWLHHLQYRWSSSRGGLIIWLKDRKTEPTISKMEQVDEPQIETKTETKNSNLTFDTPQTEETCERCVYVRGSQWCQGCNGTPKRWDGEKIVDTPQTDVYDYKGNGKWERSE